MWLKVLEQIWGFKNPVFRGYYSLEAAIWNTKYSLKTNKIFFSLLILAKRDYCEIIKHFDEKNHLLSSNVFTKATEDKGKSFLSELEFPPLGSKRSFSDISSLLKTLRLDQNLNLKFRKRSFKNYPTLLVKRSIFLD